MPAVSVVIPVFNEELRIEKCISSISNQSLKDIEIIAVNDGSTDGTLKVLESLAAADSRIIVLNYKNGGTAFALNMGLKHAKGKYIGFSGGDDWMDPIMVETMVNTIEFGEADLAICDILKEAGTIQKSLNFPCPETRSERLLEDFIHFRFDFSICNKLYRRDLLQRYHIGFDDNLKISQDVLFNLCIFSVIQKVSVIPDAFYHYVSKPGSLMSRPQSRRIESFNHVIRAFREFCTKNNLKDRWDIFTENIGPGYQKYFLNLVLNSEETQPMNFVRYYHHILSNLRLMDPLLLNSSLQQLSGYQKFRMGLLKTKKFRLFSLLAAIRHKTIFF